MRLPAPRLVKRRVHIPAGSESDNLETLGVGFHHAKRATADGAAGRRHGQPCCDDDLGDVTGALQFNPIAPLFVIVLGGLAARAVWIAGRDGNLYALGRNVLGTWLVRALLAVLVLDVVVWVARFFGLFGGPVPV